jgi:hypothetical protein
MNPEAWRSLRWLVALVVLGLVVVVTIPLTISALSQSVRFEDEEAAANGDGEGEEGEAGAAGNGERDPEAATGPVEDGQGIADPDFVVSGGAAEQVTVQRLVIGDAETLVLAFEPPEGDPACVAETELALELLEATPAEIGAQTSGLSVPDDVSSGDEVPDEVSQGENVALAATDGTPGTLRWDITEVFDEWAETPASQFVITVRPTAADPDTELAFAASEAGEEQAPLLSWTGEPGCGEDATDAGDEADGDDETDDLDLDLDEQPESG